MVQDTPARRKARELKAEARGLDRDAATLAGIRETEELGAIKANRAMELKKGSQRSESFGSAGGYLLIQEIWQLRQWQ